MSFDNKYFRIIIKLLILYINKSLKYQKIIFIIFSI